MITDKVMGMEQVMSFDGFTTDEIDPAVFALPEAVQALLQTN